MPSKHTILLLTDSPNCAMAKDLHILYRGGVKRANFVSVPPYA